MQGRSDDDDEPSFDVVDSDRFSDPEQAAEAQALAAYVWEAAKGLEPNQYAVLDLSVRQGLDSAEIADVLGVTKNNAYVMVNRMKKSLEEAIGALVLFKSGRDSCAELDAQLTRLELGEMSPEARRIIDRHSSKCPVCSDRKRKMASPFAIFGAFGMVQPAIDTKAAILEGLLQSYPYAGAAAGAAEPGSEAGQMALAGGDGGGNGASYGARSLPESLPSPPFGNPLSEGEGNPALLNEAARRRRRYPGKEPRLKFRCRRGNPSAWLELLSLRCPPAGKGNGRQRKKTSPPAFSRISPEALSAKG